MLLSQAWSGATHIGDHRGRIYHSRMFYQGAEFKNTNLTQTIVMALG